MFAFTVTGQRADFSAAFPDFGERDRLGIVSRTPGGALGASALILATITAFYDRERAGGADFFRYPDYYLFHTAASVGPYGMLDIWPEHKEVTIPAAEPEMLLRAINDRAITHLLIEDATPGTPTFERATLASVGLRAALAYAPDGRVRAADVQVVGNTVTAGYVTAVLDALTPLTERERAELRLRHSATPLVEHYRRLAISEALALLAAT
ncbi:MAG TPA: hypothetical protein VIL85_01365 [Thermomicrobiales bacterium]|jgi:hypothetical protein